MPFTSELLKIALVERLSHAAGDGWWCLDGAVVWDDAGVGLYCADVC